MPRISKPIAFLASVAVMIPPTPAPFVALIPPAVAAGLGSVAAVVSAAGTIAGSVAGAIEGANHDKKPRAYFMPHIQKASAWPPVFNERAWQECKDQHQAANLTFSGHSNGDVLVSGIASSCMPLLIVITGHYDEGNPITEGTDSALFTNLPLEDLQTIQDALNTRG